jgi:hypothetical protein
VKHHPRVALTACDANIRVKASTTTCAFAQNVFFAYWRAARSGDASSVTAYSPASGREYALKCADGTVISCRADDGTYVRFPAGAIDAYDSDQAERYACSHDLGPSATDVCSDAGGGDDAAPGDDCDPNYAGACLDPNAVDYDCDGGTGDGPDYTGEVEVVGDDPYGLDRDGDGIGCEDSGSSSSAPTTEDFGSGSGSVGVCADGTLSDSVGRQGACSHHGGVG